MKKSELKELLADLIHLFNNLNYVIGQYSIDPKKINKEWFIKSLKSNVADLNNIKNELANQLKKYKR